MKRTTLRRAGTSSGPFSCSMRQTRFASASPGTSALPSLLHSSKCQRRFFIASVTSSNLNNETQHLAKPHQQLISWRRRRFSTTTIVRSRGEELPTLPRKKESESVLKALQDGERKDGPGATSTKQGYVTEAMVPSAKLEQVLDLMRRAQLALQENKEQDALPLLNTAVGLAPAYGHLYDLRGSAYKKMNKNVEALQDFNKATQLEPTKKDFQVYLNRAELLATWKLDYQAAKADIEKAIALDPTKPACFYARGALYEMNKNYDQAQEDYERSIELTQQFEGFDWRGHMALANLLMAQRNFKKALVYTQACVEVFPDEPRFQSRNAWCLWQFEKVSRSEDFSKDIIAGFTKAIELDKAAGKVQVIEYMRRATYYAELGNHEEALKDYEEALRLEPGHIGNTTQAAAVCIELGRPQQAVDMLEPLIAAKRTQEFTYIILIKAYGALQNQQKQMETLQKFSALYPNSQHIRALRQAISTVQ